MLWEDLDFTITCERSFSLPHPVEVQSSPLAFPDADRGYVQFTQGGGGAGDQRGKTPSAHHRTREGPPDAPSQARKAKEERTKDLGEPILLAGKALGLEIRGGHAWVAENTAAVRKLDLEVRRAARASPRRTRRRRHALTHTHAHIASQTGRTLQLFRGHTAPATCLAFFERPAGGLLLITGSWDKVRACAPASRRGTCAG